MLRPLAGASRLAAALALAWPAASVAQPALLASAGQGTLLGDLHGVRPTLDKWGISLGLRSINKVLGNPSTKATEVQRQRLAFVSIQQRNVARARLGLAQPHTHAVHCLRVLAPAQAVLRPTPAEAPLFSSTPKRPAEMLAPVCRSISARNHGRVQLVRSSTAWGSSRLATAKARLSLASDGPGASVDRKASAPHSLNHPRQCRTASGVTPNASATSTLVRPCSVSRIARAWSASPRTSERDSAQLRFLPSRRN